MEEAGGEYCPKCIYCYKEYRSTHSMNRHVHYCERRKELEKQKKSKRNG